MPRATQNVAHGRVVQDLPSGAVGKALRAALLSVGPSAARSPRHGVPCGAVVLQPFQTRNVDNANQLSDQEGGSNPGGY